MFFVTKLLKGFNIDKTMTVANGKIAYDFLTQLTLRLILQLKNITSIVLSPSHVTKSRHLIYCFFEVSSTRGGINFDIFVSLARTMRS